jgi:hypothetical protein
MLAARLVALACGLLGALALAQESEPLIAIDLRGNEVLPDAVYLAVLQRPRGVATLEHVADVVSQVETFLHTSGYTLATADGHLEGDAIVVTVNEGLLEKVVFRGRLTFQMIRLRLALDLPHEVFNKPFVEEQLRALSGQLGIDAPDFELVPTAVVKHTGPQVDTFGPLGTIRGATLVRPRQQYELHVFFPERDWSTGAGLDVRSSYFDGFELGVNYQGRGLFFTDDRWRVGVMGGAGLRRSIDTNAFYVFPSRVFAEAQWFTPAFARVVRTFVWLRGEGLARQRADLGLENYLSTNSELSANIQVQPLEPARVFIGFGLQHFYLFDQRGPPDRPPPDLRNETRLRGFVQLGLELVFDSGNARWDRRHALELDGRLWTNVRQLDSINFGLVRLNYQKVFAFGWHDLWLKARGTLLTGDVLFPFEEPLGDNLRGVFGDIFVRSALAGRAEFRFSLTRDLYKLGVFVDASAWGQLDRVTGAQSPRFGIAFGPSFHALIEGMFQMDLALSFGLLSTGRFDTGVNALLVKVF